MKTKQEIQTIINDIKPQLYGRVNLPHGLHTEGRDRRPTQRLIFPKSFEGQTVLDVGCAFGYWCFEAERLGAKKVVGFEIQPPRLKQARFYKEINESQVEFHRQSIAQLP